MSKQRIQRVAPKTWLWPRREWRGFCHAKEKAGHEVATKRPHPQSIAAPVHQKAMPVILTSDDEINTWLTKPWEEAKVLQRPLPDNQLVKLAA